MTWESKARNRVRNQRTEMFSSNGQDGRDGQETHKAFRCRGAIYRARDVCIAKTLRYARWLEYRRVGHQRNLEFAM